MALAVDAGEVDTLGKYLDQDFEDRGLDKTVWLADIRDRLQHWQVDDAKVSGFNINVNGDHATASFSASCTWVSGEQVQHGVNSLWKLDFIHRENGWKLLRVQDAKFGPGGMMTYQQILQY